MKLTDAGIGEAVRILDLSCRSRLVSRRLNDLGVMEGIVVHVEQKLPFGGPFTLEADGQRIAIRRREAEEILVNPV
ncbi:hypothetical protein AWM70_06595 [Paenibacillus yonginensis]|uniref:Ferrous iron transporter FeoA-like domain-containing protein n=1 Tax=Paenibacillus yonginensis TaxID=1462996 RepID=A0A1B1MYN3_9BACL|nr:FeoA family protein [Paenibacillus yonginensis]ANS74294.1 hypothetical protein AWM70_06595 [Paenibacillus yonginensis]